MGKFKMTRIEKPAIREHTIMHQSPASGPKVRPMSPGAAKQADQLKPEDKHESGSIDPRQMHY
jgi:hypothetical protein